MLDHQDDIDADFLRFYRIDLETTVLGARRYYARADRLVAYDGALAAAAQTATGHDNPQPDADTVSVNAMNLIAPGLIERVEV